MLAAGSPIARAFPVRQGLISLSTGIGSFKYMPTIRTLQGSARNLLYSKSLIFRQGNKGLPATDRSRRRPRPEVVIGTTPLFSTGKIRQDRAGFDKDTNDAPEKLRLSDCFVPPPKKLAVRVAASSPEGLGDGLPVKEGSARPQHLAIPKAGGLEAATRSSNEPTGWALRACATRRPRPASGSPGWRLGACRRSHA